MMMFFGVFLLGHCRVLVFRPPCTDRWTVFNTEEQSSALSAFTALIEGEESWSPCVEVLVQPRSGRREMGGS